MFVVAIWAEACGTEETSLRPPLAESRPRKNSKRDAAGEDANKGQERRLLKGKRLAAAA
jgi:hypothetical protein